MSDPSPTADPGRALVERATALAPLLAEHAAEAERLRRPVDAVIEALEAAEIFKLMVPRRFGGLELDLDTFVDVGLALGEGDASMAWVATFCVEHNWMFCQFPEAFQAELYADRAWVLAPGMIAPSGRAVREGDGYRLSGRWPWATGVMHSTWVIAGGLTETADGALDPRFFALPIEQVKVEDTWYVDGMVGTGSNDVVIEDVFVPAERSVSILAMAAGRAHGAEIHEGPLYHTPMLPILALAASTPAVGQARAAVRLFRERLHERVLYGVGGKQAEQPAAQMRLARAELELRQAELLVRDVAAEVCALRNDATLEHRACWAAALALAVQQSKRIIQSISEASGASAHLQGHPLQRMLRDIHTLSCHVVFDLDARLEAYGRLSLGLETPGLLV
jgi:alkylation response protein AidB-like acyl-CoA dehydrogenase